MTKTQKPALIAPKNIQLTLITTATITLVMNTIFWIHMLVSVYPHGMRISQFSVMALGLILMPVVFFALAFFVYSKNLPRLDEVFKATLLTLAGLGIHAAVSIIERLASRYQDLSTSLGSMTWSPIIPMLVSLCLFIGLLAVVRSRDVKAEHTLRLEVAVVSFVVLAFLIDALFNVGGLVSQHIGRNNIWNLLTHPMLIVPVVLPLAFFATAYLTTPKNTRRLAKLFITLLYTLVGVMTAWTASMLFTFGLRTLSLNQYASAHINDLQTTFIVVVSLAVFAFLLITHNTTKRRAKRLPRRK